MSGWMDGWGMMNGLSLGPISPSRLSRSILPKGMSVGKGKLRRDKGNPRDKDCGVDP